MYNVRCQSLFINEKGGKKKVDEAGQGRAKKRADMNFTRKRELCENKRKNDRRTKLRNKKKHTGV